MDTIETISCTPKTNNTEELGKTNESMLPLDSTDVNAHALKEWINEKFDFLISDKNLGAITWLTTVFTTFVVGFFKIIRYVSEYAKVAYWDLPVSIIDISNDNIVYDIMMSVVFGSIIAAFLLFPFFIAKATGKPIYKIGTNWFIALIVSASMFFSGNTKDIVLKNGLTGIVAFIITDILFLAIIFSPSILFWWATLLPKQNKATIKKSIVPCIVISLILSLLSFSCASYFSEKNETRYRITHDGYAIIYETDDYYYLAKYDTVNNKINKNTQKSIEKTNIEYTWITVVK